MRVLADMTITVSEGTGKRMHIRCIGIGICH